MRVDPRQHCLTVRVVGSLLHRAFEHRAGAMLSPDGWEYWEGSISLARGCGYAYFGGNPIFIFPPAFSAYLAVVQSIFLIIVADAIFTVVYSRIGF